MSDETSTRRQGASEDPPGAADGRTGVVAHPTDTLPSATLPGRDWQARLGKGPWTPIDDEQAEHLYGWDLRWRPVGAWTEISGSVVADLGVEAALAGRGDPAPAARLHCEHWLEGDGSCCRCGEPNWCPDDGATAAAEKRFEQRKHCARAEQDGAAT